MDEECLDFEHCMYGKLQLRIEMKQVMSTYDEIEDELLEQLTVCELRKLTRTISSQILQKKKIGICRDQDSNLGYCGHNAGS